MRAVLAALNVAAERRRAAALDCRHHLELVEADVTDIGSTPRRPVIAEDIRDLQLRTKHYRGRLGRQPVRLAPPARLARLRQPIERALDGGNHTGCDPHVARCRVQFFVTQERLDLSDVDAVIEEMGREAVAQRMQRHALLDPGCFCRLME